MKNKVTRHEKRAMRKIRIRAKIHGTTERPRLAVFRSLVGMYLQLIDDTKGKTLVAVSMKKDVDSQADAGGRTGKVAVAYLLGKALARKAAEHKITTVLFDRGGFAYHGRVKAVAEGAREGGLVF